MVPAVDDAMNAQRLVSAAFKRAFANSPVGNMTRPRAADDFATILPAKSGAVAPRQMAIQPPSTL
jgi:hypothetical protein